PGQQARRSRAGGPYLWRPMVSGAPTISILRTTKAIARKPFPARPAEQASVGSGLTFRTIFAINTFIALQRPRPVRSILKPLGDAGLGMDCTIHHRDGRQITVGHDLFHADLAVAQQGDKSNEHEVSIEMNDSANFTMQCLCQSVSTVIAPVRMNTENGWSF